MGCWVSRSATEGKTGSPPHIQVAWCFLAQDPAFSYGTAKSGWAEIFPECLLQASLVLLGVDFGSGFLWFGGGCLGLFCIVCLRQNSSTTAKEQARECTSYPYLKEVNRVIFHLEITNVSRIWEKDRIHIEDICTVFCWVGDFWHHHWHASNFFQTLSLWKPSPG